MSKQSAPLQKRPQKKKIHIELEVESPASQDKSQLVGKYKKKYEEFQQKTLNKSMSDLTLAEDKPRPRKKSSPQSKEAEPDVETSASKQSKKKKGSSKSCDNYELVIQKIKEMRKEQNAPVDSQGAGCQADPKQSKDMQNWQIFLSLLLSVQTKDETTDMVTRRFVKKGLTMKQVSEMSEEEIKEMIFEVNFNAKKAKYIKDCVNIILNEHGGKFPSDYTELVKLPGVGPKIANLFLQIAFGKVVGIAVDTHVHRISNRLKWVKTTTPEKTKDQLEEFMDKKYWNSINQLLVGFGQTICLPNNPKCSECIIKSMCYYQRLKKANTK